MGTMSKTLHIVHPQFNFSSFNTQSVLLDNKDTKLSANEYHTSLADLSGYDLLMISQWFDLIIFHPDTFFDKTSDLYNETTVLLTYIQNFKTVTNFEADTPVSFTSNENMHTGLHVPSLWVFGCSHSHGVGLQSGELRYGEILANDLNLPLKLVTKPGSSLHWSLRHIMSANITKDDIVVWQITAPSRVSIYDGKTTNEVLLSQTTNRHLLEVYTHSQIFFNHMTLLTFGIQYLRAKNIKFVLTSIEDHPETTYRREYVKYPEYCYAPGFNIDFGTDGLHHGPLSHKRLATSLLHHIQFKNVYSI